VAGGGVAAVTVKVTELGEDAPPAFEQVNVYT